MTTIHAGENGYDAATRRPVTAVAVSRFTHAGRYIFRASKNKTMPSPAELEELWAIGCSVYLIWETSADAPLGGRAQGILDGRAATAAADSLGYPAGLPILVANDLDVWRANVALVRAYNSGFWDNSTRFRCGGYLDEDAYAAAVADGYDPVWCLPNAFGWSPHYLAEVKAKQGAPFAGHIIQGHQDLTRGWDAPNLCTRPFEAWGPPPKPQAPAEPEHPIVIPPGSPSQETSAMDIITNSETTIALDENGAQQGYGPNQVKWGRLLDPSKPAGHRVSKLHLSPADYEALKGPPEIALTNKQLMAIPDFGG